MNDTCGHRYSNICDLYFKDYVYGNILCLRHTLYPLVLWKKILDVHLFSFNNSRI